MKKAKKLLVTMLSVFAVTAGALGMTACDNGMFETQSSSSSQQVTENEFRKVYAMYVEYAEAQGQIPMSYEMWLMSIRGEKGDQGEQGEKGEQGEDGVDGLTPYIGENGNWWIGDVDTGIRASGEKGDKGDQGDKGETGVQGPQGETGAQGEKGDKGEDGDDGKSAYQIWLDAGNNGTAADFLAWLKGEAGEKGDKGDKGDKGEQGETGAQGPQGEQGAQGDKGDKGDKGEQGEQGETGAQGPQGEQGEQGVGIEKVEYDENGNLVITFTDGTTQTVEMPEKEVHTHEWGEGIVLKEATREAEGVMLYVCACGEAKHEVVEFYSKGLQYALNEDEASYSVTGIGECTDTDIVIPSKYEGKPVTGIGAQAFYENIDLISVKIPDSVASIGKNAFSNCFSLTIYCEAESQPSGWDSNWKYPCPVVWECNNNEVATDGYIYVVVDSLRYGIKDGEAIVVTQAYSNVTTVNIPESITYKGAEYSVTTIGEHAFQYRNLTSAEIGDSVTTIGKYAFTNHSNLTSVEIGNSVITIGNHAFRLCRGLTSVEIPDSVESIGVSAFYGCSSLTSVVIGKGVKTIGENAFNGCDVLAGVVIPDSVTSIGEYAFYGCSSLTSVEIPDSVTTIGNSAFSWCTNLTSVLIGDGVTTIGKSAFNNCKNLTSVLIGDSVATIGNYAFNDCESLTEIQYNATECADFTSSSRAFAGAGTNGEGITVTIGANVKKIPEYIFRYSKIVSVVFEEGSVCESIKDAFYECDGLTSVYITDIASWCKISFEGWSSNPLYYAKNLYVKGELVTNLVIPDGVTSISNYAFSGCLSLTSAKIPDSVTNIGDYAFGGCGNMVSVNIPTSVTSIGGWAFRYCMSLTSVEIPDSVTSLGHQAFEGCRDLTNAIIGEGVTSIGDAAFFDCDSLTSVEIPDSVTSIGNSAFCDCAKLTSVVIGDSVTSIGYEAFGYCESLTDVYYKGTAEAWDLITIASNNEYLTNATRYYYSETQPTEEGNWWHYDENGEVAVW